MPQVAHAQDGTSITVTPDSGLVDGQVVEVHGTGFVPDVSGVSSVESIALVCLSAVLDFAPFGREDLVELLKACGTLAGGVNTDSGGSLSGTLQLVELTPAVLGDNLVRCGDTPNDCLVLAASLRISPFGDGGLERYATAFISFGSPIPQSKSDCKNGGWPNLANTQGQPFRNEGQCVAFVVAHPR
jgi:hypothetical protein